MAAPLTIDEHDQLADLLERYYATAHERGGYAPVFYDALQAVIMDCRTVRNDDPSEPGRQAAIAAVDNDPNHPAHPCHW